MYSTKKTADELLSKDAKYVWHAMKGYANESTSLIVDSAEGAWIKDVHGKEYLDGMSGLWCVNIGYGREELARAAYDQLTKLSYFPLSHGHNPSILLAEKLNEYLDDDYVFFFSNSGSEANETAFKIARQYHHQRGDVNRYKFISRYRAYHGNTMGALAATGQAQRKYKYEPLGSGFIHVAPPDLYRNPEDRETLASAEAIDQVMKWELSETIAGVIMEPIITGGGVLIPPENYMKRVREICENHGALLIVDEVICGFGRTGEAFGFMNYGVKPDVITMAKGITSAYMPLAATAVKREIFEEFVGNSDYDRFRHVNTYGGSPASCAVALKNLEIMEEENLFERSKEMGKRLLNDLEDLKAHPNVGDVRGNGLLLGIELVEDKRTKDPIEYSKIETVMKACKNNGLLIGNNKDTVAGHNNIIQLCPPLSITEQDYQFIVETLLESFQSI
ncbi:aspartate aminotransferase family protein [Pseudalkalibacillus salsuginis]|uniref:aspartate aminotransferase family protein n=1 Tax=Pseudalkalibacillus salsuginis TaxID=2910972 RepID=UPI001F2EA695|nr:aspartate aminotransferase family protein [Pseudalkalibacillus salsuginis]MCF6409533.1 aspartate aminotransferase family protein [Pseudalkalibacillus salsuginis]